MCRKVSGSFKQYIFYCIIHILFFNLTLKCCFNLIKVMTADAHLNNVAPGPPAVFVEKKINIDKYEVFFTHSKGVILRSSIFYN